MVNIVCEINPPKSGINQRVAGIFVSGPSDKIFVAHRGIFNPHGRVPFKTVRQKISWNWSKIQDGINQTEVMLIIDLYSSNFPERLKEFVLEAKRFKDSI